MRPNVRKRCNRMHLMVVDALLIQNQSPDTDNFWKQIQNLFYNHSRIRHSNILSGQSWKYREVFQTSFTVKSADQRAGQPFLPHWFMRPGTLHMLKWAVKIWIVSIIALQQSIWIIFDKYTSSSYYKAFTHHEMTLVFNVQNKFMDVYIYIQMKSWCWKKTLSFYLPIFIIKTEVLLHNF